MDGVDDLHLDGDLVVLPARAADRAQLARVHAADYLEELERFCATGGGPLDADTYATTESWDAARLSAGAGLVAVEALAERGRESPSWWPAHPATMPWPTGRWGSA